MKILYLAVFGIVVLSWSCTTRTTLEGPVAVRATGNGSQPTTSVRANCAPATSAEVSAALDRIFADKDERVILMRAKSFTIPYAREELAKLGHTSPDSLSLVHAVIRFSGGSGPCALTPN